MRGVIHIIGCLCLGGLVRIDNPLTGVYVLIAFICFSTTFLTDKNKQK